MPESAETPPLSDLSRARNSGATAAELEHLAATDDADVQQAVAQHPNTPPQVLWKLARTHPAAVWKNPVLNLLALEKPSWMNDVPRAAADALFSHEKAPARWMRAALRSGRGVRQALACNPAAPPDVLDALVSDPSPAVHNKALQNPALPLPALLRELQAREPREEASYIQRPQGLFLMHPQLPADLRRTLWRGGMGPDGALFGRDARPLSADERSGLLAFGPVGRAVVAANPWTPAGRLRELADDANASVRWALAGNATAPPDVLDRLVADPVLKVGKAAAMHLRLSGATATLIRRAQRAATRSDPAHPLTPADRQGLRQLGAFGRLLLAGDPGCAPDELRVLSEGAEEPVQQALCANPATPADVMEQLAEADGAEVLAYAASNPNLPAALLEAQSDDDLRAISGLLLSRPELPEGLVQRLVERARQDDLYASPHTLDADLYPGRLPTYVKRPSGGRWGEAFRVAIHPAVAPAQARAILKQQQPDELPLQVLAYAAGAAEGCSREEALQQLHPKVEVLLYMAGHEDDRRSGHRAPVVAHPGFPARIRTLLARAGGTDDFRRIGEAQGPLTATERTVLCALGPFGRRLVAAHPGTPQALLRELAEEHWDEVMEELAGNPSTPSDLVGWLLTSTYIQARRRAEAHPKAPAAVVELLAQAGIPDGSGETTEERDLGADLTEQLLALGPIARTVVADNHYTPPDVLRALAADPGAREVVASNEHTPADVLDELARTGAAQKTGTPDRLPAYPAFIRRSEAMPAMAQRHERRRVQEAALANPGVPLETLVAVEAEQMERREAVAANPKTPPDVLARLAACDDPSTRAAAARNPSTPEDVRTLLHRAGAAEDLRRVTTPAAPLSAAAREQLRGLGPFGAVLADVSSPTPPVWNPNADREEVAAVRHVLAVHRRTTGETLARLIADGDYDILRPVARHPQTPPYVLGFLLADRDQRVRAAAAQHTHAPADLLALLRKAGADEALHHPTDRRSTFDPQPLSFHDQLRLLYLGDFGRTLLACHPGTHDTVLCELAHPEVFRTDYRLDLLARDRLPLRCLERLLVIDSTDPEVYDRLCAHPDADPDDLIHKTAAQP